MKREEVQREKKNKKKGKNPKGKPIEPDPHLQVKI